MRIFYHWIKILIKTITLGKLRLKRESFLGFKVELADYRAFSWVFDEIFFRNNYYFETEKRRPIIFDCGANIGIATLYFKWLFPESTIYCFEPDPLSYRLLKKNIEMNQLKRVYPFQVAVAGKAGKIDFYSDVTGAGSLTNSHFSEHESAESSSRKRTTENLKKEVVPTISLSDFIDEHKIRQIDLLKIDVEGMEEEVVANLSQTQKINLIEKIILEYHHKMISSPSRLGRFLKYLEKNHCEYQLDTHFVFNQEGEWFQDVLLRVYSKNYAGSPGG